MKAVVLIDGENFSHKVESIIDTSKGKQKPEFANIKLKELIDNIFKPFGDMEIQEIRYYAAKLHEHKETLDKSKELIDSQRKLKINLEKAGIKFISAGHVRAQYAGRKGKKGKGKIASFKEKGVDVRVAVDMVAIACDHEAETIILCSSDSDLQPAVAESRKRGVEVIYLGFSTNPNKGLTFTTNKTVLFRNPEILASF